MKGMRFIYPVEKEIVQEITITCWHCKKTRTFKSKKEAKSYGWIRWTSGKWHCDNCEYKFNIINKKAEKIIKGKMAEEIEE